MANGSYICDTDEAMLAKLVLDGSNATKVAERFRSEVARADRNAQDAQRLRDNMEGMKLIADIFASKGVR